MSAPTFFWTFLPTVACSWFLGRKSPTIPVARTRKATGCLCLLVLALALALQVNLVASCQLWTTNWQLVLQISEDLGINVQQPACGLARMRISQLDGKLVLWLLVVHFHSPLAVGLIHGHLSFMCFISLNWFLFCSAQFLVWVAKVWYCYSNCLKVIMKNEQSQYCFEMFWSFINSDDGRKWKCD